MKCAVVEAPSRWVGHKFAQIADLDVDKALFVPWEDLDAYGDGEHVMRVYASMWSRRLGRKFTTRKGPAGMYVIRHS